VRRWIDDGLRDPEGLWERAARELPWFRPWSRAFVWDPPTFRWFVGAETTSPAEAESLQASVHRSAEAFALRRCEKRLLIFVCRQVTDGSPHTEHSR